MNFGKMMKFCTKKKTIIEQNKIAYDYIYGINPVVAAIYSQKRKLEEIYINENQENQQMNPRISNIIDYANKINLPVKMVLKQKIERLAGQDQPHQNVVLRCSPKKFMRIEKLDDIESRSIVFFDQITDPQNFGSILRTAFYLGIDGFLVEENKRCPLNSTISKVSSGAMEMLEVHCYKQAWKLFKQSSKEQYVFIGTGFDQNKQNLTTNDNLQELIKDVIKDNINQYKIPVIIFGSESNGISQPIIDRCDFMLNIPSGSQRNFPQTLVDSLNVGVSAGIILNHIIKNQS